MNLSVKMQWTSNADPKAIDPWHCELHLEGTASAGRGAISHVRYLLHQALKQPLREVTEQGEGCDHRLDDCSTTTTAMPNRPYRICFSHWGWFWLRAHVHFRDGTVERLDPVAVTPPSENVGHLMDRAGGHLLLAKRLKAQSSFKLARLVLEEALSDRSDLQEMPHLLREAALVSYKDTSLIPEQAFEKAEQHLESYIASGFEQDAELTGLRGSIAKRRWERNGRLVHLEQAYSAYHQSFTLAQQQPDGDGGAYGGVNAAFIADLIQEQHQRTGGGSRGIAELGTYWREQADRLRKQLVQNLLALIQQSRDAGKNSNWWLEASLAEAHFGLGEYAQAKQILEAALDAGPVTDWQRQSTRDQFAKLAQLRLPQAQEQSAPTALWEVLGLLGLDDKALESLSEGRVGLSMSGGGFRASLYHLGVLARLAELDILRKVEVLSCVSGGSVVGAHYYLLVRDLLQKQTDEELTAADYCKLVDRLCQQFVAGVQKNLRTRVGCNLWDNLRIGFGRASRTGRLAELYEKHLFSLVEDGEGDRPRWLDACYIRPLITADDGKGKINRACNPRSANKNRRNKIPILVLNATALNTGHVWQFTASWMGEPPTSIEPEIDGNERLRRLYHEERPLGQNDDDPLRIRLGAAVAASSGVPGLFDPITLRGLYPERVVRLVDGGVHDNQGVQSLFDQHCDVVIVSDASGGVGTDPEPADQAITVLFRTTGILQACIRQGQVRELGARVEAGILKSRYFVHGRVDLPVKSVSWCGYWDPLHEESKVQPPQQKDCKNKAQESKFDNDAKPPQLLDIRRDAQRHLCSMRTDLDSFSDLEAHALMVFAYRLTQHRLQSQSAVTEHQWSFLAYEEFLRRGCNKAVAERVDQLLKIGSNNAFRAWQISPLLRVLKWILAATALAGLCWWLWRLGDQPIMTMPSGHSLLVILLFLLLAIVGGTCGLVVLRALRWRDALLRIVVGVGLITVVWIAALAHLAFFDRLFLKAGKHSSLKRYEK